MDANAFEKSHQTNEDGKDVETIKKRTKINRSGRRVKLNHYHPTHVHNTPFKSKTRKLFLPH